MHACVRRKSISLPIYEKGKEKKFKRSEQQRRQRKGQFFNFTFTMEIVFRTAGHLRTVFLHYIRGRSGVWTRHRLREKHYCMHTRVLDQEEGMRRIPLHRIPPGPDLLCALSGLSDNVPSPSSLRPIGKFVSPFFFIIIIISFNSLDKRSTSSTAATAISADRKSCTVHYIVLFSRVSLGRLVFTSPQIPSRGAIAKHSETTTTLMA